MTRSTPNFQDRILDAMIFFMTAGSGYTTVMGAKEIFPSPGTGIIFGIAAQVALFLLLTNRVLKGTPLRKWSIVSILASFSIYTSSFSFYETLARTDNDQKGFDRAVHAHQVVQSTFYTPMKAKLETAISERDNVITQRKKELSGDGITQQKGPGDEAKRYAIESVRLEAEIAKMKIVGNLKPYFEYETKGLEAEDFLEKDRKAVASIPPDLLPDKYKNADPNSFIKRGDYIEEISNIKFLLPYQRIKQGDKVAQLSFSIASLVDGVMILLSSSIDASASRPFKKMALSIAYFIAGFKSLLATVVLALDNAPIPYDHTSIETDGLKQGIDYISIKLQGKGTEFLECFIEAIDPYTLVFDMSKFKDHAKPTFKVGFRILLNALRSPKRRWCTLENGNFSLREKHRDSFYRWISEEMIVQAMYEESLQGQTTFSQSVRNIRFGMPSSS
jgi:hypothetical protein